jgi:hypothetical protein
VNGVSHGVNGIHCRNQSHQKNPKVHPRQQPEEIAPQKIPKIIKEKKKRWMNKVERRKYFKDF